MTDVIERIEKLEKFRDYYFQEMKQELNSLYCRNQFLRPFIEMPETTRWNMHQKREYHHNMRRINEIKTTLKEFGVDLNDSTYSEIIKR